MKKVPRPFHSVQVTLDGRRPGYLYKGLRMYGTNLCDVVSR